MKKMYSLLFTLLVGMMLPLWAQNVLVNVHDNSIAEWDNLPAAYVFEATCPQDAVHKALRSVKVYADAQYINVLVEPDMSYFDADEWVPFHMYIDADNSDLTGGYGDEFLDANADIVLETAVMYGGELYNYNPAVFKWWGEVGGNGWQWVDPDVYHDADDYWGAIVGEGALPIGSSQIVDGKLEIQIDRYYIPVDWNNTEFGIGFDILHNWASVGILPQGSADPTAPYGLGRAAKMKIIIDGVVADIQVIDGIRYILNDEEHTAQIIGVTSAGKSVILPEEVTCNEIIYTVTSIREGAFAICNNLKTLVCESNQPLSVEGSKMYGLEKVVIYVPDEALEAYQADPIWGTLLIRPMSAQNTDTNVIVINASETTVNIIWPAVEGAESYEMIINDKNGNIVCTLIFNANGQLTSIIFSAPARDHAPQQVQNEGFSFTVDGLQTSTGYDLTINAKDGEGNTLTSQTMSFTTGTQGLDELPSDKEGQWTKTIRCGQVLIHRGDKIYTVQVQPYNYRIRGE